MDLPSPEHGKYQAQLIERLDTVLEHFRKEYDMTAADVIGVLEILKLQIFQEAIEDADDEYPDPERPEED